MDADVPTITPYSSVSLLWEEKVSLEKYILNAIDRFGNRLWESLVAADEGNDSSITSSMSSSPPSTTSLPPSSWNGQQHSREPAPTSSRSIDMLLPKDYNGRGFGTK
jgi:hypothetical protein